MHATPDTTIRDIVAADFRAASVFHKHGIDFCCKGARPIGRACEEGGIDVERVLGDLRAACSTARQGSPLYSAWDVPALTRFIVGHHHAYVREAIPTLLAHTSKVARVHGTRHAELEEVAGLFADIAAEMQSHMAKEEQVLFPWLEALARAEAAEEQPAVAPFGTVANPIRMMEQEHDGAGAIMARIRDLTSGYEPPADACTTYRVCFEELQAFEADLHTHVHLENNILFPKALELEARLLAAAAAR